LWEEVFIPIKRTTLAGTVGGAEGETHCLATKQIKLPVSSVSAWIWISWLSKPRWRCSYILPCTAPYTSVVHKYVKPGFIFLCREGEKCRSVASTEGKRVWQKK